MAVTTFWMCVCVCLYVIICVCMYVCEITHLFIEVLYLCPYPYSMPSLCGSTDLS